MRLFTRKQLEIVKFASRDDTRIGLNGVYVDGETTVATDGHRLLMVKSKQMENADWPANSIKWSENDKPFTIPLTTVEKALRNVPKKVDLPILERIAIGLKEVPTGDADKVVCQTTDLDTTDNVEARIQEGKFPNYKQVIPDFKDSDQYQRVGVSAGYLKDVCAVLEKYNPGSKMITLYVKKDTPKVVGSKYTESAKLGENYSIVLTADDNLGNQATAVIMPLRL